MASSSSCLPFGLTIDNDDGDGYKGWDPRKIRNGSSRPLTDKELYDTVPREEIDAYHAKVKETEGFDISGFPYAGFYGSIRPYPLRNDRGLEILSGYARSALDFYNKDSDISYEFVKLVRANYVAVAGSVYYLTFVVKSSAWNSSHLQNFQARVRTKAKGEFQVLLCRPEPEPEPTPPPPPPPDLDEMLTDGGKLPDFGKIVAFIIFGDAREWQISNFTVSGVLKNEGESHVWNFAGKNLERYIGHDGVCS